MKYQRHLPCVLLGYMITTLIVLTGCGSGLPQAPNTTAQSASETFNPLEDLLGQAQSALKDLEDPSPQAEAVVRFVIFTTKALPQTDATFETLVNAHFKLTAQTLTSHKISKLAVSKLIDRFSVSHLSAQDDLPINLGAFTSAAQQQKLDLSSVQGLTFVTYQGRALKGGLQLDVTCKVTSRLATSPVLSAVAEAGVWVASLATLEVLDIAKFDQRCRDPQEHWVRPGAELVSKKVRMISRGLNQWGRPELELGPLSKDQAPKRYPRFLKAIEAARSGRFPEKELMKSPLSSCQRPPHHYETSCRRLTW